MSSITVFLADDEGNGLPDQSVKLRSLTDNFAADVYTMSNVTGEPGAYKYSGHVTNTYKVWVNGVEDKSFGGDDGIDILVLTDVLLKYGGTMTGNILMDGNRIKELPDPIDNDEPANKGYVYSKAEIDAEFDDLIDEIDAEFIALQEGIDARLPIEGGTMDGDINMDSNQINNLPAPTDPEHAVRVVDGDSRYAKKGVILTPAELVRIYNQFIFYTLPLLGKRPVGPFEVTDVKFVQDYVNNYLSGINSTVQQTEVMIIIDFNGTVEANKRYNTMVGGINQANEYAAADRRIVLLVEGSGNDDTSLLPDYNRLPVSYDPYIDIVGIEQSVILIIDEGENYASTNLGENIINNVTCMKLTGGSPSGFTKKILRNVKFTSEDGIGQYDLTDCIIENCSREGCTVTTSGCIGNILDITNSQEFILHKVLDAGGAYEISYANGDIRGRRQLGRQGADVASAAEITLGVGNYFVITGTADIEHIIKTGWTAGSVITLQFQDGLTILNAVAAFSEQASIITSTVADKTFAAADIAHFVFTSGAYWKEL